MRRLFLIVAVVTAAVPVSAVDDHFECDGRAARPLGPTRVAANRAVEAASRCRDVHHVNGVRCDLRLRSTRAVSPG